MLAPFDIPAFRRQWPADLATQWAFEMETLVLGWYVLAETGSVVLLTVFAAFQYLGSLLAPLFGVAGDRIGTRNLLAVMRATYVVLAAVLAAFILSGNLTPTVVLAISAIGGAIRPSDLAIRSALIAESMPPEHLMAAMGIARTTTDSARIVGALVGASLFAWAGIGPAWIAVAALYAAGLLLTLRIPRPLRRSASAVRPSPWRDLGDGIAYVWSTPRLLAPVWIAFLVNLTAFPLTNGLLPYVAREVYRLDQTGLGYLAASFAFGSLLGSLWLSLAGRAFRSARMMLAGAVAWYLLLLAFAPMPSAIGAGLVLMLAGFAQNLCLVPLSVVLLRAASEGMRGRVMGVRILAIYGLPVGLIVAGALIERIGFEPTLAAYAITGLAGCLAAARWWRKDIVSAEAPANAR